MSSSANPLRQLENFGQSVWLDYIRRHLLLSPEFRHLIEEDGLKGMTSNPTIFEKAIGGSNDYDEQFAELVQAQKGVDELYEALTTDDIKRAADALRSVYDSTDGRDGFVSFEVSPQLANDTKGTIAAAHRYFEMIGRPNLMVKVPATPAGLPAIEDEHRLRLRVALGASGVLIEIPGRDCTHGTELPHKLLLHCSNNLCGVELQTRQPGTQCPSTSPFRCRPSRNESSA